MDRSGKRFLFRWPISGIGRAGGSEWIAELFLGLYFPEGGEAIRRKPFGKKGNKGREGKETIETTEETEATEATKK